MKRSPALTPLSHDHHQALVVAQRLRRAEEVDGPRSAFLRFWVTDGSAHFRIEEEVLLPIWSMLGCADAEHVARIAGEHLAIRAAALELESDQVGIDFLHRLGELLGTHVRFEERELFPAIEEDLDAAGLEALAAALAAADKS